MLLAQNYSNSQSSICFMVLPQCFSFKTVRFRTVLHVFAMFLSDCIVILLSVICYTLKSTNSLKYYSIHKALQFPYKLKFYLSSWLSLKSSFPGNDNKKEIIIIETVVAETDGIQ